MAINNLEKDTVSRGCAAAKMVTRELKPLIDSLNILYDTETTGVKATLTQEELNEVPSWSDLTKQQLDDGMYALTAVLKTAIDNVFTALEQLAGRS